MCGGVEEVRVLNATNTSPWQGTYRRTTFHMVGSCDARAITLSWWWLVAVVAEHYYLHLSSRNYYYYYIVEKSSKEKFFYMYIGDGVPRDVAFPVTPPQSSSQTQVRVRMLTPAEVNEFMSYSATATQFPSTSCHYYVYLLRVSCPVRDFPCTFPVTDGRRTFSESNIFLPITLCVCFSHPSLDVVLARTRRDDAPICYLPLLLQQFQGP